MNVTEDQGFRFCLEVDDERGETIWFACPHDPGMSVLGVTGTWKATQRDPLTVMPSINCTSCGCHGWIRDGKWVPA